MTTEIDWSQFDIAGATIRWRKPMAKQISLEDLISALEEGGKSDGRGLRVTSYSALYKAKDARLAILDQLKQLRTIEKFDHYPTA